MIQVIIYVLIGLNIIAALARISQIGEQRKPITTKEAIAGVVITGLYVWLWIYILGQL